MRENSRVLAVGSPAAEARRLDGAGRRKSDMMCLVSGAVALPIRSLVPPLNRTITVRGKL